MVNVFFLRLKIINETFEQYGARKFKTDKIIYFTASMKRFIQYISDYAKSIDKRVFAAVTLFTAMLVFINYYFGLDDAIRKNSFFPVKLIAWYAVFLCAFGIPYLIQYGFRSPALHFNQSFLLFVLLAPLLFAVKISYNLTFNFTDHTGENNYWNHIVYWPVLLLLVLLILFVIWKWKDTDQPFYGLKTKGITWKPYWMLLLCMVPLVALAATQPDFQAMYPKLQSIKNLQDTGAVPIWKKILFELSYGSDFITIEFFFRGFLILGFIKWAGKDAILPMACFYCTIHFGKPLGECISSYFGGMILGILVYNTRSVLGGLLVHLGVAWMMEITGYIR
jgi:hypothetical protein